MKQPGHLFMEDPQEHSRGGVVDSDSAVDRLLLLLSFLGKVQLDLPKH